VQELPLVILLQLECTIAAEDHFKFALVKRHSAESFLLRSIKIGAGFFQLLFRVLLLFYRSIGILYASFGLCTNSAPSALTLK